DGAWTRLPTRLRVTRPVDGVRSVDGSGNNADHPAWGKTGTRFRREVPDAYGDGVATPSGADRPGAREVSNALAAQSGPRPDVRVNEQIALAAMHVVFLREHNRVADAVRAGNPTLDDDAVYETARRWVGAEIQAITFREFLPALLGRDGIAPYRGHDPTVDPA